MEEKNGGNLKNFLRGMETLFRNAYAYFGTDLKNFLRGMETPEGAGWRYGRQPPQKLP